MIVGAMSIRALVNAKVLRGARDHSVACTDQTESVCADMEIDCTDHR